MLIRSKDKVIGNEVALAPLGSTYAIPFLHQ